jgi:hypothetical protein
MAAGCLRSIRSGIELKRVSRSERQDRSKIDGVSEGDYTMKRRTFFQGLFGGIGAIAAGRALGAERPSVLIQESPLAGFQFYEGDFVWPYLAVDARLELARESENIHDPNAVAVYFRKEQLGYVPRVENSAIAQMLDRGEKLEASISKLNATDDPWDRVWFSIFLT